MCITNDKKLLWEKKLKKSWMCIIVINIPVWILPAFSFLLAIFNSSKNSQFAFLLFTEILMYTGAMQPLLTITMRNWLTSGCLSSSMLATALFFTRCGRKEIWELLPRRELDYYNGTFSIWLQRRDTVKLAITHIKGRTYVVQLHKAWQLKSQHGADERMQPISLCSLK